MSEISTATRQELVQAVGERYRTVSAEEKGRILDEFVALTGYHRKHAIRVLNGCTGIPPAARRKRLRLYDEAVHQALIVLWEASDRICGKRLKPLLPVLLPALERHGHISLDPAVREQLLTVSASTIDRMLSGARASAGGRRARTKTPGGSAPHSGSHFCRLARPGAGLPRGRPRRALRREHGGQLRLTLVLTDIASGWIECIALLVREGSLIVDALERLRATLPFPLRGIDTDNGSEFINEFLITFCADHGIEFTRSRPYRKNDQAWVEQKNGSVVRRLVGYGRLEGIAAGEALSRLYSASRLFVNFFQPSFKLADKERVGAHVRKRYHAPETPCARLLASTSIAESMKDRLRAVLGTLDPLRLLDEIRTVQHHLAGLAAGERVHVLPHRDADLDRFMKSLAHAWRDGEVRPRIAQDPSRRGTGALARDPFEATWPRVVTWLESEPDRTAKELFERLRAEGPGDFAAGQVRTLQRRVKEWRRLAARRLVFAEPLADLAHGLPPQA